MAYFYTSKVNVFPSTYRQEIPNGKFTSERNFVNILNSFIDYKTTQPGYVLSYDENTLKVVIHGYYFEIYEFNAASYKNAWLSILVEKGSNSLINYNDKSITLDDVGGRGEFKGISIDVEAPTKINEVDYDWYSLQIISNGEIVNRARLSTNSIRYRDEDKTASVKIDEKQDKLTPLHPIKISQDNKISLDDSAYVKFSGLSGVGSATNPVYFNSNGQGTASNANVGKNCSQSGNVIESQAIVMKNGNLTGGQSIYASTNNPTASDGKVGDFWFKYSN